MIRRPPRSTRTDTLFPYTTLFRSNRAVTDLIEPGSTLKPLTVAAELEAGVVTPDTLIDTNPGWMPNGRYRTTDTRNHGVLTVTGVITKSSNVGVSKIVAKLDDKDFYEFLRRFGYGESTESGFPGEAAGLFPPPSRWSGTTKQTLSYGYGISVTPLQIAHAYAALANDGRLIEQTFQIGRAHVCTPVPNEHIVCRLLLEKKKH